MTTYVINGDESAQQLGLYQQMLFNDWSRGVSSTLSAANNPIAQTNAEQITQAVQSALQNPSQSGTALAPTNVAPGAAANTGSWLSSLGNMAGKLIPGYNLPGMPGGSSLPSIPNATFVVIGVLLALGALLISQRETVIKVAKTTAEAAA